jgi:4-aminobutyrate aminotransferase-like enzyme/Ser/Thr protein kinase RdoA (MazF antagonist)
MTLESQRPAIDHDVARGLLRREYGLEGTLRPLPSERDQNFLVTTASGRSHVLKISGSDEPRDHVDMQNALLEWLATRGGALPVPSLVRTRSGSALCEVAGPTRTPYAARVLTWLPGITLAETRPHSPALLRDLGAQLAAVDMALRGFEHPGAGRAFVWDLTAAPAIIDQHRANVARDRQPILDAVLTRWTDWVEPVLPSLRRQVIYNDANDHNVLVQSTTAGQRVTGLVDYGDALLAPVVCDPAIAIAYAMLAAPAPLEAAAAIVAGYHGGLPLTEEEIHALLPLALARLGVSVCLSGARKREAPDNEYLVVTERPAWAVLEQCTDTAAGFARALLRHACGLSPCPVSPHVVRWIADRTGSFAPVVQPDPSVAATTLLDLSVGTTDFPNADRDTGTEAASTTVFRHIAGRNAMIGVGRYDEARLIYLTDAFAGTAGEHPERRTVHLGIDLFLEAGAPVCAPTDGIVHSVQDNAGALDYGPTVILRHEPSDGPTFYTLYGHLNPDCLSLVPGQNVEKGERFARIGCFEDNGRWPPHLHFQIVTDLLERSGEFPGVALPSERQVWLSLSPDPSPMLGLPRAARAAIPTTEALLEQRRSRLGPNLSVSYGTPLHIVRGRGQFLCDAEGRAYLDCVNNVCHVGHANPRVVAAVARQMAVLNTNTRYLHSNILRFADALRAHLPAPLSVCYFVNSGSEANDLALRMARAATGGTDLIVLAGAYHGHTAALIDASPYKHDGPGGEGPSAHVHPIAMPDDYRGRFRRDDPACGPKYADLLAGPLGEIEAAGARPAAFICETMLSCGGQIELPPGYLEESYARVRTAGGICIADEVQVGFGRMGTHFWGFETQGVVPDIVTLGKPIGNGHPLGAVITTPEIARAFDTGMEYFNTFGGNPVSCAAGLEVLRIIDEWDLQAHAHAVGAALKDGLTGLMAENPLLGDVRGRGLFLGIELVRSRDGREPAAAEAAYVVERMKDHGVLLSTDGPDHNVIKIKPTLVFTDDDAERLVSTLARVLRESALTT